MYIKQVTIQGFRSYRDQIKIEPFSHAHNVVVGRNGSGKSNFFYAIQFVLSDEFSHLRPEQRQGLLHEGTGPRVIQAYVEIVFDNSDNRVPIDKDEVVLNRTIGAKKDQYFLDGKGVTKTDVMNLLESAGFSRSNPYYIVKQGKINELATAKDDYRLKLLREVAGTRVYDERKEESKKILKETESKREKIDDLLKYIEERLTTLEEETKELKEYQKLDKMKRSLEYTIYDHELKDTRKKLDELAERRENSGHQSNQLHEALQEATDEIQRISRSLRELKHRFSGLEEEHKQLSSEQGSRFEQKTNLELDIDDVRRKLEEERTGRRRDEEALERLNQSISDKNARLEEIVPRYEKLSQEEYQLNQDLALAEQRKKELYAKQGRKNNFTSKEARDKWIGKELKSLQRQIRDREDQIKNLKQDLDQEQERIQELEAKFADANQEIEGQRESIEQNNRSYADLKQKRDQFTSERQELWRHENSLTQEIANKREELNQIDHQLRSLIGKGIMQGIESVKRIIQDFSSRGTNSEVVRGYHGVLIENFETEKKFFTAVEVTAGSRLFYHIVDTDRIGTKILSEMNRQKFPGEANFIPLNRIEAREVAYPNTNDAIPMIEHLHYSDRFKKAIRHVFGRTLICRNMEAATALARQQRLDCITLEGDQVSCKGALTGGYYDTRRSRLELQSNKKLLSGELETKDQELDEHKAKLSDAEGRINSVVSDLQKIETKIGKMRDVYDKLKTDRTLVKQELHDLQARKHPKERQLADLQSSLAQFRAHEAGLQEELGTDLLSQLNPDEQAEADTLTDRITALQEQSKSLFKERTQLESEKNKIENFMKTNLLRKRDELQSKLHEISVEEQRTVLENYQSELTRTNSRLAELSKRLLELDAELESFHSEAKQLQQQLEKWQNDEREIQTRISEDAKEMEKMANKQHMLLKKKEECMKKIRELGSLPSDAFDKYQNLSLKQLFKKLDHCNQELKKYENVNKKALDQFVSFSEQKETLHKRREELDNGYKSIVDLMNVLEQRKYEAIQLTFRQVSKYFEEVFNKLVPQGKAQLVMKKGDVDDSEKGGAVPLVETFTGVGIRVSFTGTVETREMQQLSGGQKSLVALALIFAIQRCDPAPFYLFDEIDAALDAQHRKAVADMIHELSKDAQFIVTTFRPELLEKADKFYGVRFRSKVSHIDCVTLEEAKDFVEDDATHG